MRFIPLDIGTYQVRSRSREGHHIVDVIEHTCSCEGYQFYNVCEHLRKAEIKFGNLTSIVKARSKLLDTCLPIIPYKPNPMNDPYSNAV